MKINLPWLPEEIQEAIKRRDEIVKNRDFEALFKLTNDDFHIALLEILNNQCDYNPINLNQTQKTLFLCMQLENSGQGDTILSFLQEDYADYKNEAIAALFEIGAIKSAKLIKQAVDLLPKDGTWFYKSVDENSINLMHKLDSEFSNYPDGKLIDLYRKYAETHKNELLK